MYDAADQVTKVQIAYGAADQADEVTTTYIYDGFDRLSQTRYPTAANGTVSSTTDYEGLTYDANGNVTQRRLRDGQLINYSYDNLNRVTLKDVPTGSPNEFDITYQYDLLGHLTRAIDANTHFAALGYDALGRQISEQSNWTTRLMQYDLAGRRTRFTWGDSNYVSYDYLTTGEVSAIRENGAASGVGVLASYSYDNLGRMSSMTRGNGNVTSYVYDPVSRLATLTHDLGGTANDVTTSFTYNAASQIASNTRSNDNYAWLGHYNVDRSYSLNGLNQLTTAGATSLGYDGRGNLTMSGASTYGYTSENRMASAPGGATLTYDPLGRLHWLSTGGPLVWYQYDGDHAIEERDTNGVQRRYVWGPGSDAPIVWYEGAGLTDRRWQIPDERGSIIAVTDSSWNAFNINRYDEYGIPAPSNLGRFQYTGQAWLPEIGMYYYKARMYSPTLGRFMQTDPIGYGDGPNWYNYVHSDAINGRDPSGLAANYDIVVTGSTPPSPVPNVSTIIVGATPGFSVWDLLGPYTPGNRLYPADPPNATTFNNSPQNDDIVVTGKKVHGIWTYGNYCGAGGMGTPVSSIDAACMQHDKAFGDSGADWTNMQSEAAWRRLNANQQRAVRRANQALCNAMANIYPTIPWWNVSQRTADSEINYYFHNSIPVGAQCH